MRRFVHCMQELDTKEFLTVTTTVATVTRIEEGQEEMKAGIQGAPSAKREVKIA